MSADGRCTYNFEACAPDDPRLLALTALVAPVEVRPAAPAPTRDRPPLARRHSSDQPARFAPAGAREGRGHRGAPPRRTPNSRRTEPYDPSPPSLLSGLCSFDIPFRAWQAEEAVTNLPLRLAVRVHCGHQVRRGTLGVLQRYTGVLTAYSRGAHSLYGYTATGQHAARNALLSAERAFPSFSCRLERRSANDRRCGCRGWSCS